MTKSLVSSFVGFLSHYGAEALAVSDALKATLTALPIDAHDKATILDTIDRLAAVPASIEAGLKGLSDNSGAVVKVNKKDVEAAIAAVLPEMLDATLKAVTANFLSSLDSLVTERLDAITKPGDSDQSGGGA